MRSLPLKACASNKSADVNLCQRGISSIELIIVVALVTVALGVLASKRHFAHQARADEALFSAAASLATGVLFAHQQWQRNGHTDGDDVDDLEGFRLNHLNMTFNGWPRSTSGEENHASMTRDTCAEIWQELVDDRWKEGFITTAEVGNLGLCRFTAINMEGVVEYDVRRGRVKLTVG
ncbi:MAG: hypothetical protein VX185_10245 [Pseudomonadota bacterium]|nr:hypothetical protein [Pseudomonadota bacterium]